MILEILSSKIGLFRKAPSSSPPIATLVGAKMGKPPPPPPTHHERRPRFYTMRFPVSEKVTALNAANPTSTCAARDALGESENSKISGDRLHPLARAVAEPGEKKSPRIVPSAGLLAARARRGSGTPPRVAGGLGVGPHGPLEAGSTQHAEAAS